MQTTTSPGDSARRYRVEWSPNSPIKQVSIVDVESGRRYVGSDWASWDVAYREALHKTLVRDAR